MLGSYTSAAFTTATGVAVAANAAVEVRRESDSALASIFSDRAGASPITQPGFQADALGRFVFYAAGISGGYQVKVTKGAETNTVRYQATGTASELDADPFWAGPLAAATKAAARATFGFQTSVDAKMLVGDGTDFLSVPVPMGFSLLNGYIDWTVAGNVLTVAVKTWAGANPTAGDPVYIAFRDPTAATGLPLIRKLVGATSISINDTALLGTINATAFRLWCVAFDDAGTVRLAVINCLAGTVPSLSIFRLAGWGIASSTLRSIASDLAHVFYSEGADVVAKAYAVLGYATWETGLAIAGTWSAAPTRMQMFGPGVPLPGQVVQSLITQPGSVATGTTILPSDDTIPQNTEGVEFMTQAITPTSAANVLLVETHALLGSSAAGAHGITIALFVDSVADALVAITNVIGGANFRFAEGARVTLRAAQTTVRTLKMRAGAEIAGTLTFNGAASARLFGGVAGSFLKVDEVTT